MLERLMGVQPCLACGSTKWSPTGITNAFGLGSDVVQCDNCDVRFYSRELYPVDDQMETDAHLKLAQDTLHFGSMCNLDDADTERHRAAHLSLYDSLLDELGRYVQPLQSLYEVGTHVGYLLAQAASRGLRVGGCEVDVHAARLANETFGLSIEPICFEKANPGSGWDAVSMMDVIEHTPTPSQDLARAHAILRPGGVLLLKTFYEEWHHGRPLDLSPGSANLLPEENIRRRGYYGIGHRCHWTTASLLAMLTRTGFGHFLSIRHEKVYGQITVVARRD
jgi:SAM-dependent methyltransferase